MSEIQEEPSNNEEAKEITAACQETSNRDH